MWNTWANAHNLSLSLSLSLSFSLTYIHKHNTIKIILDRLHHESVHACDAIIIRGTILHKISNGQSLVCVFSKNVGLYSCFCSVTQSTHFTGNMSTL